MLSPTVNWQNNSNLLGVRGLTPRLASILLAVLVIIWIIPRHHDTPQNEPPDLPTTPVPDPRGRRVGHGTHLPSFSLPKIPAWSPMKPPAPKDDLLIVYAYSETENAYENAEFFIKHGVHGSAQFIFILNGEAPLLEPILPTGPNIEIFRRNNTCFDMGAYGHLIREKNLMASRFTKFILLNASIRGPFLPTWSRDCWSTAWLGKISDTMKLQGMSVNCARQFHVQSMIIGTDKTGLGSMYEDGTFDCPDDMWNAQGQEVQMASKIMNHGWEINAWLTALHGDPSYEDRPHCAQFGNDDHLFNGAYFGFDVHPYETIFVKANRNVNPAMLGKMTEWHGRMNYSSYDYC